MTIIVNDACTINVSYPKLVSSIMLVNVMPQFGASVLVVNYAPRAVSYAPYTFIIQATSACPWNVLPRQL